jgi:signal peptidase I
MRLFFFLFIICHTAVAQDLPEKNRTIIEFCESNKGKKVGRGECWDLAKAALDEANADWISPYQFGRELGPKEKVLPGDIIQFEGVTLIYPDGSGSNLPHHTAVIYEVLGSGKYVLAEQNTNNRRFVVYSDIDLNAIKKGRYTIYRPQ